MKASRNGFSFLCIGLLTTVLGAANAYADDADKAACASLDEGDACTRGDGDPGVCQPDGSNASVLSCDDDALGTSSSDGCTLSAVGARSSNLGLALGAAALVAIARRRRA